MTQSCKKTLRKQYLSQRMALSEGERSSKNLELSLNLEKIFIKKNTIYAFIYESFRGEPDLNYFVNKYRVSCQFSLPKINSIDGEMEFYPFDEDTKFVKNKFGINEPFSLNLSPSQPDNDTVIIIPCVAADKSGFRLGYGGGYYDRYLNAFPNTCKIGILFDEYLIESLPEDPWDQRLDFICTDKQILLIK